jgi:hypothetical protein
MGTRHAIAAAAILPPSGRAAPIASLRAQADQLREHGIETHQARLVLAAAQLLITANLGEQQPDGVTGPDSAARVAAGDTAFVSAGELLREASMLAAESNDVAAANAAAVMAKQSILVRRDPQLVLELNNRSRALRSDRGATGGPIWREGFLGAKGEIVFSLNFEGGHVLNRISVAASNGKAALSCTIIHAKGEFSDNGPGSGCGVKWDQKPAGKVTLRIRNSGAPTYFQLTSN